MSLSFLKSPTLNVPHGFSTRVGGVSEGAYASLNLGLTTGDAPDNVQRNRRLLLDAFGVDETQVCALQQVHGNTVVEAKPSWHTIEADAAVTNEPDLLLVINTADCLPVLFYDPETRSIGAAHAGWRGTVQHIAAEVIGEMRERYGSSPSNIRVALGPCIQQAAYQVGEEVKNAFDENGFPSSVYKVDDEGRYRLDIPAANRFSLVNTGIKADHIHSLTDCTYSEPERFFSHRRDGLRRGSHWSVIKLPA